MVIDVTESDHEFKISRREFSKAMIGFGAAAVGLPGYNLTGVTDVILKEDGGLVMYPVIYEYKYEFLNNLNKHEQPWFKRIISIKFFGCNWNCKWCPAKFYPVEGRIPIKISIDQIMDFLLNLDDDIETMLLISGGEPLLQREEVLKLIESLKTKTNYTVMLRTNGSLIEKSFIDNANDTSLDGIVIAFFGLDDDWYRWYTGHSNKGMINSFKLTTEIFKGKTVVDLILFPHMDMTTFENTISFFTG